MLKVVQINEGLFFGAGGVCLVFMFWKCFLKKILFKLIFFWYFDIILMC
jgi:hypothetical protein